MIRARRNPPTAGPERSRTAADRSGPGLRPRLLLAFLLAALAPMVALFLVVYQYTQNHLEKDVKLALVGVADVQQRRLDLELHRLVDQLALLTSRTQLRISLRDYNRSSAPGHRRMVERILHDALPAAPQLRGIWVRDPQGQLVAAASEDVPPQEIPPAAGPDAPPMKIVWASSGPARLWLSRPLDFEGETVGTVLILSRFDELLGILEDFPRAEQQGKTLLLVSGEGGGMKLLRGRLTREGVLPSFVQEILRTGTLPAALGNQRRGAPPVRIGEDLAVARPVAFDIGHLLVYLTLKDLAALLWHQTRFLLLLIAFALFLCLFMSVTFSRMISRPLQLLAEASRALREGRPGIPVREDLWGEFGELAHSFNEAVKVIDHRTSALHREIEKSRHSQQELAELANTDPLTGLINRRHFMHLLARLLGDPEGLPRGGALLLYLDLDGFKPVNDRLGHEAGDRVLQVMAERLRHLVRDRDYAARLGGDEFALLLLEDEPGQLDPGTVLRRAEEHLARPIRLEGRLVQVSCSGGVARLEPGTTPQEVLNRADRAMYRAKSRRKGRGTAEG